MDARALENLKIKITGLVSNCEVIDSSIGRAEDWQRIGDLARLIAKLKSEWIGERQAQVMIYQMVSNLLFERSDKLKINGKLSGFIDAPALIDYMVERVSGLPFQYNLYYGLPNFYLPDGKKIELNSDVRLEILNDDFVKGESQAGRFGLRIDTESCYFRTRVTGYCDHDPSGETIQQSLTLLKTFVERGKNSKVLMDNFFIRFSSKKEAAPTIYIHELCNDELVKVTSCSVSKDVAEVLTRLQFASGLKAEADPVVTFTRCMQDFLKLTAAHNLSLSRVIAACEWSFDADSEHVPAMKVVKTCIGLESVYGEDNAEGGLTKSLSDRCAYSLATDMSERREIMKACKELYKLRSSIVHGVKRKLSDGDSDLLMFGMKVLTRSIDKEILLLPD